MSCALRSTRLRRVCANSGPPDAREAPKLLEAAEESDSSSKSRKKKSKKKKRRKLTSKSQRTDPSGGEFCGTSNTRRTKEKSTASTPSRSSRRSCKEKSAGNRDNIADGVPEEHAGTGLYVPGDFEGGKTNDWILPNGATLKQHELDWIPRHGVQRVGDGGGEDPEAPETEAADRGKSGSRGGWAPKTHPGLGKLMALNDVELELFMQRLLTERRDEAKGAQHTAAEIEATSGKDDGSFILEEDDIHGPRDGSFVDSSSEARARLWWRNPVHPRRRMTVEDAEKS